MTANPAAVAPVRDATPTKAPSLGQLVQSALDQQAGRFQAVLPKGFDQVRFTNLVLTAVKGTPQLLDCFRTEKGKISLLLSAMQAATLGLEPNTPLQEAWLLPRKIKGVQECQLSIGYVGILKLARRSGEIQTIYAEVVREHDQFDYQLGTDPRIDHKPAQGDRGALTHAYAVVRYKDGGSNFIVLSQDDVHARRARSDSWRNETGREYSPWMTSPEAMWRKSAIRALRPYLPLTAQAAEALEADERVLTFTDDGTIAPDDVVDAELVDEPETEAA